MNPCLSFSVFWLLTLISNFLIAADEPAATPKDTVAKLLPWHTSLAAGMREAQLQKRPILIRFGADFCPWCRKLESEIEKPAVQKALQRLTLVALEVEKAPADARRLTVGPVPALRIVSLTGSLLEWHDGYLAEAQLIEWLDESFERTNKALDDTLLDSEPPTPLALQKIVRQFGERAPAVREAAIRRLMPHMADSAEVVVNALQRDKLSTRLAALELLREWQAPLDGLDPWRPETMTTERVDLLKEWLTTISANRSVPPPLTPEALAAAREQIDQLLKADDATAAAIRERLARHKIALLPEVVARLKASASDAERNVLLALRYRLAMDDGVFLRSPGLVERLAAADSKTRHAAIHELSQQAGTESQALFLELYADPDPFVRELSLQGLRAAGAEDATNALVKLLDDPEPNVRAAVLKQLGEEPWPGLKPRLAQFLKTEKDSDLIVQAVRCFRKMTQRSPEVLLPLLKHAEWQVRAEVLDTITGAWQARIDDVAKQMLQEEEVREAVIECLEDDDAFVASRAIVGLRSAMTRETVRALLRVPDKHPSLMTKVVEALSHQTEFKSLTLPAFKRFFEGKDPVVRAAAIKGMFALAGKSVQNELLEALQDPQQEVRIAGANALQSYLDRWLLRNPIADDDDDNSGVTTSTADKTANEVTKAALRTVSESLSTATRFLFGPSKTKEIETKPEVPPRIGDEIDLTEIEKTPAESDETAGKERDEWLRAFQAGRKGPTWRGALIPPLEKMFASSDAKERLASVIPLVALGEGKIAVASLVDLAKTGGHDAQELLHVLTWLPQPERAMLARELVKQPELKSSMVRMFSTIANLKDARDLEFLWSLCEMPEVVKGQGYYVESDLNQIYFGEQYYHSSAHTAKQKKQAFQSASKQLSSPRSWRHLVALTMMLANAPDKNGEAAIATIQAAAQSLGDDPSLDEELRDDASQLTLAMLDSQDLKSKLVEMLAATKSDQQLLALRALTTGGNNLGTLVHSQISIHRQQSSLTEVTDGKMIYPKAPVGITPMMVRPLLSSPEGEVRALAGYLLAVSEDPAGLGPLVDHWRKNSKNHDEWDRLVYRAIAATDDASQIPVLKQIYKGLHEGNVKDFYGTIRIMTGSEMLEFRKQIRKEKGAEVLQ